MTKSPIGRFVHRGLKRIILIGLALAVVRLGVAVAHPEPQVAVRAVIPPMQSQGGAGAEPPVD